MMLPTVAALETFEVAARCLSFTETARLRNLTQSAVSHQVRELETRLGEKLFERRGRGLSLSAAGQRYLPFARAALEQLRAGGEALRPARRGNVLTVSVSPNFANKWLVPRLGAFTESHPDVDLRVSAAMQHVDFAGGDIDLAVRHGDGNWPELHVTRLCVEHIFPVASPALLSNAPALESLADLSRHVLLHDASRQGWADWLRRLGTDPTAVDTARGPIFSQTSLAIDAAVAAQGVALARSALVTLDLAAGRLLRPLPQSLPADFAYWIVAPMATAGRPVLRRFREWLLAEAAGLSD
jgi:LysR family transcriptional regulator, glycine cleavage system transcriptional activator